MLYWVRLPQYWAFQPDKVLSGAVLGCSVTGASSAWARVVVKITPMLKASRKNNAAIDLDNFKVSTMLCANHSERSSWLFEAIFGFKCMALGGCKINV